MKTTLLFLLTIVLLTSYAQSQHFPDSNAIWSVPNYKYFIEGDSTYNSQVYHKFYISDDSLMTNRSFYGLFRYDTLLKKAYAIHHLSHTENLLYDFSIQLGDTTTVFPIGEPPNAAGTSIRVKVIAVDSTNLNGQLYRRLKLDGVDDFTNMEEYWIEGIGSTFGILSPGLTGKTYLDVYYPFLVCYEKDGLLIYDHPNVAGCFVQHVGLEENLHDPSSLKVFPNPAQTELTITNDVLIHSIEILNLQGQLLESREVEKKKINIDLTEYANEILLIRINTDEGSVVRKVVRN